jgi:amphiphysin
MQSFTTSTYGPDAVGVDGLETMHYERMGDVAERIDALTITKRFVSTGEYSRRASASTCQPVGKGSSCSSFPNFTGCRRIESRRRC